MVGFLWTESLTFVEDVGGVVLRLLELGQPVWNQACVFTTFFYQYACLTCPNPHTLLFILNPILTHQGWI